MLAGVVLAGVALAGVVIVGVGALLWGLLQARQHAVLPVGLGAGGAGSLVVGHGGS